MAAYSSVDPQCQERPRSPAVCVVGAEYLSMGSADSGGAMEVSTLRSDESMKIRTWDIERQALLATAQKYLLPDLNNACIFVFPIYNGVTKGITLRGFENELRLWLRFIASNSAKNRLPCKVMVLFNYMSFSHSVIQSTMDWIETITEKRALSQAQVDWIQPILEKLSLSPSVIESRLETILEGLSRIQSPLYWTQTILSLGHSKVQSPLDSIQIILKRLAEEFVDVIRVQTTPITAHCSLSGDFQPIVERVYSSCHEAFINKIIRVPAACLEMSKIIVEGTEQHKLPPLHPYDQVLAQFYQASGPQNVLLEQDPQVQSSLIVVNPGLTYEFLWPLVCSNRCVTLPSQSGEMWNRISTLNAHWVCGYLAKRFFYLPSWRLQNRESVSIVKAQKTLMESLADLVHEKYKWWSSSKHKDKLVLPHGARGLAPSSSSSGLRRRDPSFVRDSLGHFRVISGSVHTEYDKKNEVDTLTSVVNELLNHVHTTRQSAQSSIRSDVLQLGYTRLDEDFDISRMVCIFQQDLQAIEVIFLHPEGMATAIGVGLPFSQVRIEVENVVEVNQLNEGAWTEFWMESHRHHYTLLALNLENFRDDFTPPSPVIPLSQTQAAGKYGTGIVGTESFYVGKVQYQQGSFGSQFWFYNILRSKIWKQKQQLLTAESGLSASGTSRTSRGGNEVDVTEGGPKSTLSRSMSSKLRTSSTNLETHESRINNKSTDGEQSNLERDTNIDARVQNTLQSERPQLQLTVRVLLDSDSYIFYSDYDNLPLQRKNETGRDGFVRYFRPTEVGRIDDVMRECKMEAELTIQFYCGFGVKRLIRTQLKVHYHMDGGMDGYNASARDEFGWYHDKLRVAFKCEERNAARLENKVSLDKHYEGTLVERSLGRQRVTEESVQTVLESGERMNYFCGHRSYLNLNYESTSMRQRKMGETRSYQFSESIPVPCMKDYTFSISRVTTDKQEMAYQATIFPGLAYCDLWDEQSRSRGVQTGIMSTVSMAFNGDWTPIKGRTGSSPSSSIDDLGFCKYEFSCQRNLHRHKRTLVPNETVESKLSLFKRLFGRKPSVVKEARKQLVDTVVLQQRVQQRFLINHCFPPSCEEPQILEWDLSDGTVLSTMDVQIMSF